MSFSATLVGAGVLQAVIYLLFVRAVDLYEREAFRYVLPVFLWGFTVAVVLSVIFEGVLAFTLSAVIDRQAANFLLTVVGAPVIEEGAKGLALLIIFAVTFLVARRRHEPIEFSGVMDGIVYGSAVGFGFALAEDLLYFAQFGVETFVARRVFGGFAHAAFTSLTGIGMGLIPWVRHAFLKLLVPVLGFAAAILLHALFNLTATLFGPPVYVALFFVVALYVVIIVASLAVQRRMIREELREEVEAGTISPDEYRLLPTYFLRKGYYLKLLFTGRLPDWRRVREVHRIAIDLALSKRLLRRNFSERREDRVRRLRRRIFELKGPSLAETGAS